MTERHPPLRDPHLEEVAHWHPIEGTPEKKRVAIGCSVGATIETYDFIGFGIAAALYFNTVFFPANDPLSGTLLSFATLGIGFAVRPLGGIIGGYLGDRIGRKPVLVGSLLLMGVATVLIGALPTYEQVGVWAGILLVSSASSRAWRSAPSGAGPSSCASSTRHGARRGSTPASPRPASRSGCCWPTSRSWSACRWASKWAWRVPFLLSAVLIVVGHHHPAQGRGVPGVRGAQGRGRGLEEPAEGGPARRLAQHPARVLPAHRRDRGLRGVGHVHAVLPRRARSSPDRRSP